MADYNVQVSWSGKDALSDSDAGKVISGDDFHTEFTAVKTAMDTKADVASETLTGTPLAPTAAAGTNTTQLATTAFVRAEIASRVYPVGALFTTVTAYADSAAVVAVVGGTTWAAFGAGKVLVGVDTGDSDFNTIEETGGAKTGSHTLSTSEIPSHTHTSSISSTTDTGDNNNQSAGGRPYMRIGDNNGGLTDTSAATGGGGAHTHPIVQPYITVYFWKRTA
jgi:hypothetical protein